MLNGENSMKINRGTKYILVVLILIVVMLMLYLNSFNNLNSNSDMQLTFEEKEWLNQQGTLIYSADNNAPPLRFVDDKDRQYKGVVIDYINVLSLELGVNIDVYPQLWENALQSLRNDETDLCDMFMSAERAEYFLFSNPIYNLRAVVVSKEDILSIDDLVLATQKGDYVNEWLLENYPDIQLIYVDDVSTALDLLLDDKVDAVAGDEPVVLYQIKNKSAEEVLKIMNEPLYDNEVVFAIPKSKEKLLPILNKGIAEIANSGQLENIQQKWFGISTPIVQAEDNKEFIKIILIGIVILFIFVIAMITWNYVLTREVTRRTIEVINSKNDLQITFDGMSEYIVLFDLNLEIVNINQSFISYLQTTRKNLIGKNYQYFFELFESDDLMTMVKKSLNDELSFENELFLKNNFYIVKTYPLKDTKNNVKNILVVIQNITKEKLSEKHILHENKMAAIGQLAAGMGHEIRNPLGIIRNHSYMLRNKNDKNLEKSLNYIDSSVDRASRIIDNLLDFSRLTDDVKDDVNLKHLIEQLFDLERKTLMKRNIEFSLDCEDNMVIYSNIESLKHILINLISNAVDAIDKDGSIDVICFREDENIILRVEDTGNGMTADEIENIFNPFYTTKDPDKGTGLGLYIVYNEVKKLSGNISVDSFNGSKTVFEIVLPQNAKGDIS